MKIGLLKNFLHYFNLRQGTILIAIFQLVTAISMKCLASSEQLFFTEHNSKKILQFSSGFSMIFFILALAHAMGIQEMVVRDTEDALEREALEEISSNHLNTKKMDLAHHNATGTRYRNISFHTKDKNYCTTAAKQTLFPFYYIIFEKVILCICRNGICNVLWPCHNSYSLHLHHVTSLWSFDGN